MLNSEWKLSLVLILILLSELALAQTFGGYILLSST